MNITKNNYNILIIKNNENKILAINFLDTVERGMIIFNFNEIGDKSNLLYKFNHHIIDNNLKNIGVLNIGDIKMSDILDEDIINKLHEVEDIDGFVSKHILNSDAFEEILSKSIEKYMIMREINEMVGDNDFTQYMFLLDFLFNKDIIDKGYKSFDEILINEKIKCITFLLKYKVNNVDDFEMLLYDTNTRKIVYSKSPENFIESLPYGNVLFFGTLNIDGDDKSNIDNMVATEIEKIDDFIKNDLYEIF